ncbi:lysozyme [Mucilaginibacter sp. BJC16-A38]|uniref:lysozyme n=1 Tax=Mucilaginibacter phenanthrenivorans TaxID=1234842 RepID=UPI0021585538|nr:lysozyme [Mucilaginibacter phenanthrenivorans]MCR8562023.1 lysozyme [Mucilaginibacter phenanthrenivorans]
MSVSAAGLKLLQYHELWVGGDVYTDPQGHKTIGYGHKVQPGESWGHITHAQGLALLAKDAQSAANIVNKYITVKLSQTQFDALVDFEFPLGPNRFPNTDLIHDINRGRLDLVTHDFMQWTDHGAGYAIRREQDDYTLFNTGVYTYR